MLFKTNVVVALLSLTVSSVDGFTTKSPSFLNNVPVRRRARSSSSLSMMMMDPSVVSVHDVQSVLSTSSQLLSDAAVVDTVNAAAATAAASGAADAAADAAATTSNTGGLGFLTLPIETLLNLIHSLFSSVGVSNSWGLSIIGMTTLIKLVTYPLTKTQLESSVKMQALQPSVKELQAKYASNPEVMNQKISSLYQESQVNPLAGCLPALVQIPVFVGLYRAVLNLASENALDEPFLWLPSLEGPTYGAALGKGNEWLTSGLINGAPKLGWEDTAAFLTIPLILIATQVASIELNKKGQTEEQKAQTDNVVFKLLPLFLGWVSVGVPSALGIYWIFNNLITTAITLQVRSVVDANPPAVNLGGGGGSGVTMDVPSSSSTAFNPAPLREKPAGFGAASDDSEVVSPITTIDAEVVSSAAADSTSAEATSMLPDEPQPGSSSGGTKSNKKKRGKKRKKKQN